MAAVERISDVKEISFPELGWTFHIDPTAFKVFGLEIQWYGLIITIGLALALLYCFSKMKRFGIDPDRAIDAVIGGVLGGLIGARLYYVIFSWSDYKKSSFSETLKAVVNTREGGLAIYGGIIGSLTIGLIVSHFRKVKKLPLLDLTVLGLLIGQGIGRWGNFVNQEAFGTNTSSFLGMTGGRIQNTIIRETQIGGDMYIHDQATVVWDKAVHPCFLYESLWCLLGFFLLAWFSKRRKYDGQMFLMYLTWYGAERFVVEGLRTDSLYLGSSNLRVSQLLSAVVCIASIILQIVLFSKRRRDPESFVLYANTEESRKLIEESRRKRMGMPTEDEFDSDDDDDIDYSDILDDDDDDFDLDDNNESEPDDDEIENEDEPSDEESDENDKEEEE